MAVLFLLVFAISPSGVAAAPYGYDLNFHLIGTRALATSEDGRVVVAGTAAEVIVLERDSSGSPRLKGSVPLHVPVTLGVRAAENVTDSIVVSGDGRDIYAFERGDASIVHIVNSAAGAALAERIELDGPVYSLALAPDGRMLHGEQFKRVISFRRDAGSGALSRAGVVPVPHLQPRGLWVSPDSRFVYTAQGDGVEIAPDGSGTAMPACCPWAPQVPTDPWMPVWSQSVDIVDALGEFVWRDGSVWRRDAATGSWSGPFDAGWDDRPSQYVAKRAVGAWSDGTALSIVIAGEGFSPRMATLSIDRSTGRLSEVASYEGSDACVASAPCAGPALSPLESMRAVGGELLVMGKLEDGIAVFGRGPDGRPIHRGRIDVPAPSPASPVAAAAPAKPAPTVLAARLLPGGRGGPSLRVSLVDGGVPASIQLRADRRPGPWRAGVAMLTRAMVDGRVATWVRVRDDIGRVSAWYLIAAPTVRLTRSVRGCGASIRTACKVRAGSTVSLTGTVSPAEALIDPQTRRVEHGGAFVASRLVRGRWIAVATTATTLDTRGQTKPLPFSHSGGIWRVRLDVDRSTRHGRGGSPWLYVRFVA